MRKVLKSHREVAHFFANNVQEEARAGNMFFEHGKIYSYGRHFVIARRLPNDTIVWSNRGYSASTNQHKALVKRAMLPGTRVVYCYDADVPASANKHAAEMQIQEQLSIIKSPKRLHQKTRDAASMETVRIANEFNAYLEALPDDEKQYTPPFVVTSDNHEGLARYMLERVEAENRATEERNAAVRENALAHLAKWRRFDPVVGYGNLHTLPVALRINGANIETSHGANIPLRFAPLVWSWVQRARAEGAMENLFGGNPNPVRLGVYTLTKVRADGSIVVGCHDIAYSELLAVAKQLGFNTTEN